MPWKYICDNCGHTIFPNEKLEQEECRICGATIEAEDLAERPKAGNFQNVEMKNGTLTIEIEEGGITSLEDVDEVRLNVLGDEIALIKNPDFAEFFTIEDYEREDDAVDLYFEPKERKELLEKIEELRKMKSTSESEQD